MKQGMVLFGLFFIVVFSILAPTVEAQMNPAEMLQKADEARGNLEGIQWEIVMDSIENGREQNRKLEVTAKGYNS